LTEPEALGHLPAQLHLGQVPKKMVHRKQAPRAPRFVKREQVFDAHHRPSVEFTDSCPSQVPQVRTAAEQGTEILGERAHIGPFAATHPKPDPNRCPDKPLAFDHVDHVKAMNTHLAQRPIHLDALACQAVKRMPFALDRRVHRRSLLGACAQGL